MKALYLVLSLFCTCSILKATGWNDYTLDLGDGYTVFRANSLDVCIGKDDGSLILYPRKYEDVGPVVAYQMKEDYILAKTAGRTLRNLFEGDAFENVDYEREFFFLIPKATDEALGPFAEAAFADALKDKRIEDVSWIRSQNPDFWTPLLGRLMFLAIAIPILAIRYFYITVSMIVLIIWAFRKLRKQKAELAAGGRATVTFCKKVNRRISQRVQRLTPRHSLMRWLLGSLSLLFSSVTLAQPSKPGPHPQAEIAMAKIVLHKDFGEDLKFHSREVATILRNDRVPGLNGLMFMRWKGDDSGAQVMASVQWFEVRADLLKFYQATTKRNDYKLEAFGDTTLWKIGTNGYSWTDGEHFVLSLVGSPTPPEEMVKDWLTMIGSAVAEVVKEGEGIRMPAEEPKS
jgi:hypothetical protein